ncbi:hypothetical protein HMI54_009807 [Coelomomyces lativittatus]|nr:hypothetical protein HMI54_009807 [Coelomomyces lativittatus]
MLAYFGEQRFLELKENVGKSGINFRLSALCPLKEVDEIGALRTTFIQSNLGTSVMNQLFPS